MRKLAAVVIAMGLVVGLVVAPASAGKKKKKVTEEWTATNVPGADACPAEAVEGVHKTTHVFTTPGKGILDVSMTGFQADWDLYLLDAEGNQLGASTGFVEATTERIIYAAPKGADLSIVACNYIGTPIANLSLVYTYK